MSQKIWRNVLSGLGYPGGPLILHRGWSRRTDPIFRSDRARTPGETQAKRGGYDMT